MNASAVYTTATVQLPVQTLKDPLDVRVTILSQEMEEIARILQQVNILRHENITNYVSYSVMAFCYSKPICIMSTILVFEEKYLFSV